MEPDRCSARSQGGPLARCLENADKLAENLVTQPDRVIDKAAGIALNPGRELLAAERLGFPRHRRGVQPAMDHRLIDFEVKLKAVDILSISERLISAIR